MKSLDRSLPRPPGPTALAASAAALLAISGPLDSQPGPPGAETPEAAVRGLFDAMRAADSAAARS